MTYASIAIDARRALLDALVALRPHREAMVLVGAQAIYLYTGDADVEIATTTKDSDIALVPDRLGASPLITGAMNAAGFTQDLEGHQGVWLTSDGVPVELLVPAGLQPGNTRGARIPPHDHRVARRVRGLEAAAVDFRPMTIEALDPVDERREQANVAGPAALLVAKVHKIGERVEQALAGGRDRTVNKDAHDVYRLLRATATEEIAGSLRVLGASEMAGEPTRRAIEMLTALAASPSAPLCAMAADAIRLATTWEEAARVADATWILVQDILELLY